MLYPRRRAILAAVGSAMFSVSGHSHGADDAIPQVLVTAPTPQPSATLPATVNLIDGSELDSINLGRDISNIFRSLPGVLANSIDQGDTGNGFRMRGFATSGSHGADTAVYIDGVPQNMPSSEAGAGHGPAFLEWLTADMVKRIEVIKGPVSALYGDQNRAGAVNITTRSAGEGSSVGLALESYSLRRASLASSTRIGRLDSFLVADSLRSDSYRKGAFTDRDNLFWKLSTRWDDGDYSLRLNHYRSNFQAAGYLLYERVAAGLVARNAAEENALPAFGGGERTALVFNRAPADGARGWSATAYAEQFQRTRGASAGGSLHNVGTDDRDIFGGRLAWDLAPGPSASLLVGVDLRRDRGDATRQRYINGAPTLNYLTNLDLRLDTAGLFAQGQYRLSPALALTAGLRVDSFDYAIGNRKRPDASTAYSDTVATPRAGLSWRAGAALSLFANAAEGFRSPAAQQISPAGAIGPLDQPGGSVNTAIAPSRVRSYDAGFSAYPASGWHLAGSVYHTINQDEIVLVAPDVFRSAGDTTRQGLELETRYSPGPAWSLYANAARIVRARINNPAPGTGALLSVPRDQLKIGAQFRRGQMTLNTDASLLARIPYYSGAPLRERTMPSYTSYDLRAAWDIDAWQLALYATLQPQAISEAAYATAAGLYVSPQPRRHGGISLRYRF